jgi:hypothetical protein
MELIRTICYVTATTAVWTFLVFPESFGEHLAKIDHYRWKHMEMMMETEMSQCEVWDYETNQCIEE